MFGGLFVDRHVYERKGGRGRYVTFSRRAQLRLALVFLLTLLVAMALAAALIYGFTRYRALEAQLARVPAASDVPVADETTALRAALEEGREKRAELAAELETQRQLAADAAKLRVELAQLQGERDGLVQRQAEAEAKLTELTTSLEIARRQAQAQRVDPSAVPDRIRALELELEMARAGQDGPAPGDGPDATARITELTDTVAALEAERDQLKQQIAVLEVAPVELAQATAALTKLGQDYAQVSAERDALKAAQATTAPSPDATLRAAQARIAFLERLLQRGRAGVTTPSGSGSDNQP